MPLILQTSGKREKERASLAVLRLHPNLAAVVLDHLLAIGQADAVAWNALGMVALEEVKNALPVAFLDSLAVVADAELPNAGLESSADADPELSPCGPRSVFDGIVDQVAEDRFQALPVRVHDRQGTARDTRTAASISFCNASLISRNRTAQSVGANRFASSPTRA